jgi:signal transduction histidine kinase
LAFDDGRYGRIEFRPTKPPRPPSPFGTPVLIMVLVVVGISSLALSRSIAKPLRKLSDAARALGEGDLDARSGVDRSDELGDVAHSFDVMAERVGDLLRAERELVANVSHELRTPLARIRVALDIAAEGDVDLARESLGDIAEDVDDLERLVNDLLAAARLDIAATATAPGGIPPLQREAIALDELVASVAERFETTRPERPLQLAIDDDLPGIVGDPVLLRRAVANLLENADKYSEAQDDPIRLSLRAEDGELVLTITDQGIGIAADDLPRVFEPFFRADKSRTRATGGHGLGLALTRRIVEAHEGRISLESTLDEGTRVEVRLPT